MLANPRFLGIVALLIATTSWGGLFLVSKPVLQHVEPFWFTVIRYALSGAFLLLLIAPRGAAPWRKLRANAWPLAWRGFAGFGVFSVMLLVGLAHSVPSHGAVIIATGPITTQLMRWVFDGVRPTRATLLTAALALAGVVVVSGVLGADAAAGSTWFGDLVMLVGTVGWIVYTRGAARFAGLGVVEYTALTVFASWPLLLMAALAATLSGHAHLPSVAGIAASWHGLLYVGLISSAIAVLAFNYGVRALGAVTATAFLNFVPVSALLMSIALGKPPAVNELVGIAMVIGALLLHTAGNRSAAAPQPARRVVAATRCPAAG